MNNKGQTLVVFVILLPILCILIGYILEKGNLFYLERRQKELANTVCKYALNKEKSESQIRQLVLENDHEMKRIDISYYQGTTQITLLKEKKSIFSNIIGKDSYTIKTTVSCIE